MLGKKDKIMNRFISRPFVSGHLWYHQIYKTSLILYFMNITEYDLYPGPVIPGYRLLITEDSDGAAEI